MRLHLSRKTPFFVDLPSKKSYSNTLPLCCLHIDLMLKQIKAPMPDKNNDFNLKCKQGLNTKVNTILITRENDAVETKSR